ncbi:MAG: HRDC domain-containing protein [Clostridium sp.]
MRERYGLFCVFDYKIQATVDENESKTLEENQAKEQKISSSSLYEVNIIEKQTSEVQCNCDLYDTLKKYRYDKAKEEGNKPYFIFNNKTLDDLIEINPKSKDELLKVQGFGQVKVDKYGDDIIRIISLHDESNNEEILN